MPSKRKSSACVDYVPALCTHRPSLLPIEWLSEASGLAQRGGQPPLRAGKLSKLGHLEEVKVVTRSPLVNQRRDHYRVYNSQTQCERYQSVASAGFSAPGASQPRIPWRPPEDQLKLFFLSVAAYVAALFYFCSEPFSATLAGVSKMNQNFQQRISWFWHR